MTFTSIHRQFIIQRIIPYCHYRCYRPRNRTTGCNPITRKNRPIRTNHNNSISNDSSSKTKDAQQRAYEFYKKRFTIHSSSSSSQHQQQEDILLHQRNVRIAMYATAVVIGAVGATYASVPLYKIFCQMTGFGGTTQRVQFYTENNNNNDDDDEYDTPNTHSNEDEGESLWNTFVAYSKIPLNMLPKSMVPSSSSSFSSSSIRRRVGSSHVQTWTDEDAIQRLASLRPVSNGRLITVRFDSTVGDVLPWSFRPTQLDVKVIPGETALSFFTATNHSKKPITGVATYNVYPPRAGLYFHKIQCFCFEEQRLLPGETVDMPVFFFIDPEFMDDPQLARVHHVTLSYTFFQTNVEEE